MKNQIQMFKTRGNEPYVAPAVSAVVLQSQNSILLGSSDIESAGIQDYVEQPGLSW
jgi:hypothetical protein